MRYEICVNQKGLLELGITNFSQGVIFDLVFYARDWATPDSINGQTYFWVSRHKIASEFPLLDLKADTVYRHLKNLHKSGLIDYQKKGKKDYVRITDKGSVYSEFAMSEINPNYYVGNKSEKNSEINPTNPYYNINKDIYTREDSFEEFFDLYPRKQNPQMARQEYEKIIRSGGEHSTLIQSLKSDLPNWEHRDINFIPYAENWLKGGNWISTRPLEPAPSIIPLSSDHKSIRRANISSAVMDLKNTTW